MLRLASVEVHCEGMNLLENKTAHLNYHIHERFEAGMVLSGTEVKSLRQKHGSLKEAYISISDIVSLLSAYIPPYQGNQAHNETYDPYQKRSLLLNKKEIEKLKKGVQQRGYTVIPIRIYTEKNLIKIEIALASGKHKYDKREDLKKKSVQRDLDRELRKK